MKRTNSPRLVARRALALAGLALLAAGLASLTGVARPPAAAAAVRDSALTVHGPRLYNGTSGLLRQHSTVTVSQTDNLVNQMVQVSWAHFTPSGGGPVYDNQNSLYAVMIAECRGTHPTAWSQCYGAGKGGLEGVSGPAGPYNTTYAVTASGGRGTADINVETGVENSVLGCDQRHPCSLVVVSGQGGNQVGTRFFCNDHRNDVAFGSGGNASPAFTFSPAFGFCSWKDRIVIPLHFSPATTGCPLANTQFTAAGSPMMARAMLQWLSGLCAGTNPLNFSYNSEIQEPQALQEASSGIVDVALTTRPASADSAEAVSLPSNRHFIYAPIGVSAVSIASFVDDPNTGQPDAALKLDPRLVAKLLTTSYGFGDACQKGVPPPPDIGYCNKAVSGNPLNLFADPEFTRLNTAVSDPQASPYEIAPLVESGNSDMTWTTTRWIGADPAASAFLRGQRDPWGAHVDTYYRGLKYPTDSYLVQDPYPAIQHQFNPLFPLSQVAYHMSVYLDAGTTFQKDPTTGNYIPDTPEVPGRRALVAFLDNADSAAFLFPSAAIRNAAGRYVQPTAASMAAAVQNMISGGSGTEQVNLANTDPAAYPLTMVIYAAVPTAGTPQAKAAAIARFLDFAAGAGQTPGEQPGQLPVGYLPLPQALRAQTQQAATEVANQSGNASQSSHGAPTPSPIPSLSGKPTPSPSLTLPPVTPSNPPITTTTVADPQQAAGTRYVLPVVLMLGGLSALAGSSALLASGRTTLNALLGRAGRAGLARGRRAWSRLALRRQP